MERLGFSKSPDRPTPAVMPVKAGKMMAKTVKKLIGEGFSGVSGSTGASYKTGSSGASMVSVGTGKVLTMTVESPLSVVL